MAKKKETKMKNVLQCWGEGKKRKRLSSLEIKREREREKSFPILLGERERGRQEFWDTNVT